MHHLFCPISRFPLFYRFHKKPGFLYSRCLSYYRASGEALPSIFYSISCTRSTSRIDAVVAAALPLLLRRLLLCGGAAVLVVIVITTGPYYCCCCCYYFCFCLLSLLTTTIRYKRVKPIRRLHLFLRHLLHSQWPLH